MAIPAWGGRRISRLLAGTEDAGSGTLELWGCRDAGGPWGQQPDLGTAHIGLSARVFILLRPPVKSEWNSWPDLKHSIGSPEDREPAALIGLRLPAFSSFRVSRALVPTACLPLDRCSQTTPTTQPSRRRWGPHKGAAARFLLLRLETPIGRVNKSRQRDSARATNKVGRWRRTGCHVEIRGRARAELRGGRLLRLSSCVTLLIVIRASMDPWAKP